MEKRDFYEVLGVARGVTEPDLKKAYRREAMKHHPDRNPGDASAEVRFKEANEAYEVLSDKDKRASYDQFGHAGLNPQGGGAGAAGFSDIFGDMFGDIFGGGGGGGRGRSHVQRGSDLSYTMELSLEDAVKGTSVKIKIPTRAACKSCEGAARAKDQFRKTVQLVRAPARCVCGKALFRCSKPAHVVRGLEKLSRIPAMYVMVVAPYRKTKPCRLKFPQALM